MGIGLAMVLELMWISPAPWPTPTTPLQTQPSTLQLVSHGGTGAVLDLPFYDGPDGQFYGDIFYQQTIHGRPLPFRLDGMREQVVSTSLRENRFYRELESELLGTPSLGGSNCEDAQALGALGFDAIVLHGDRLNASQAQVLARLLEACLGPLETAGDSRIAWLTESET